MRPLAFVNWRTMNMYFCAAMWLVVTILAIIIIGHMAHDTPTAARAATAHMIR